MAKNRTVELTLVVRLDPRLDDDLEALIKDYLESEGLIEVTEISRIGMTGTIDLPRVWLPTQPSEAPPGDTDPPKFPPAQRPAWPPQPKKTWPWRKK